MGTKITAQCWPESYNDLVQATNSGKVLQYAVDGEWYDLEYTAFPLSRGEYRVKPEEEDTAPTPDNINPSHYTSSGIECIEYQKAVSSPEEFRGYLRLCATKYLHRLYKKGEALENLDKALWYLNRLRKELESNASD